MMTETELKRRHVMQHIVDALMVIVAGLAFAGLTLLAMELTGSPAHLFD
jgi:hypothetical protein